MTESRKIYRRTQDGFRVLGRGNMEVKREQRSQDDENTQGRHRNCCRLPGSAMKTRLPKQVSCWALLLNVVSSWLRGAVCRSAALDHTQFSGHENTFTNIRQLEVIFRVAQEKEVQMVSFPACAAVRVDEHETITNDWSQVVF